jgi:hypothetical protein
MRFISFLGLGKNDTVQVGFVLILLFALLVGLTVYFLKISSYKSFVFLGFVVFSPPILLLFESVAIILSGLILILLRLKSRDEQQEGIS